MRLLTISYGFMLQRAYQWKAVELERRCEALLVVVPERWKEIWSPEPVRPDPGPLDRVPHREVRLHLLIDKHFALLPFRELDRILSEFRPDVVEFDNEPFNLASAQLVAAVGRRLPEARVFLHGAQNLLKRYPPPFNWLERYVFARCAGVFARNPDAAEVLRRRGLEPSRIHVMGHGVSLEEFAPARERQRAREDGASGGRGAVASGAAPAPSSDTVLYVGALHPQKGVDVLLRAAARARAPGRILLAGDGPDRAALEALAAELGLGERVHFLGRIPQEQLLEAYGEAGCLVLPSRTTPGLVEQFGRVLLEAMASGCPVVASNSGHIPAVVGEAGLVVPEEDPGALAGAMDRVLTGPGLRRRLREAGVERVRAEYEWSVVAERMMEVFRGGGAG